MRRLIVGVAVVVVFSVVVPVGAQSGGFGDVVGTTHEAAIAALNHPGFSGGSYP